MRRPVWEPRRHTVFTVTVAVAVVVIVPLSTLWVVWAAVALGPSRPPLISFAASAVIALVAAAAVAWWGRSALVAIAIAVLGIGSAIVPLAPFLLVVPVAIAVWRGPDGLPRPDRVATASSSAPMRSAPGLRRAVIVTGGLGVIALQPFVILEFVLMFSIWEPSPTTGQGIALGIAHGLVVVLSGVLVITRGRSALLGVPLIVWGVASACWWGIWLLGAVPAIVTIAALVPIAVARVGRRQLPDSSSVPLTEKVSQEFGEPS